MRAARICNGSISCRCGALSSAENAFAKFIIFNTEEPLPQTDAEALFGDDSFYFYDETLQEKLPATVGMKLVRANIKYLEDSSCFITLKLIKGDVDNEGTV